jgi:hypothetical protein
MICTLPGWSYSTYSTVSAEIRREGDAWVGSAAGSRVHCCIMRVGSYPTLSPPLSISARVGSIAKFII